MINVIKAREELAVFTKFVQQIPEGNPRQIMRARKFLQRVAAAQNTAYLLAMFNGLENQALSEINHFNKEHGVSDDEPVS